MDVSCIWGQDGARIFFFQAEDGIRDQPRSRGLGDVYKRQGYSRSVTPLDAARVNRTIFHKITILRTDTI